jgi:hypothetical protein
MHVFTVNVREGRFIVSCPDYDFYRPRSVRGPGEAIKYVILSVAKDLSVRRFRSFAALRMTGPALIGKKTLSGASRRAILPFLRDSACVCTGARSSPIGISYPAAITDKSGYDMINRPSHIFRANDVSLRFDTHDLVGSNESRAAFCHAQRVKCHGKEPVRVQFPQIDGRS